jgi:uncharacterized damage-inducible protein DinB
MAMPEPWLRGTHSDLDAIQRQVIHALELTVEDVARWCDPLTSEEMALGYRGLEPVAFHLRHIARSLDRLLSYAEGTQLDHTQMAALKSEMDFPVVREVVLAELRAGLDDAMQRVLALQPHQYNDLRGVGRAGLPSTVGGLLVHCAEHTQRHTGQAVTTAKLMLALRENSAD